MMIRTPDPNDQQLAEAADRLSGSTSPGVRATARRILAETGATRVPSPSRTLAELEAHRTALRAIEHVDMTGRTPGLHDICPECRVCLTDHPGRPRPAAHLSGCSMEHDEECIMRCPYVGPDEKCRIGHSCSFCETRHRRVTFILSNEDGPVDPEERVLTEAEIEAEAGPSGSYAERGLIVENVIYEVDLDVNTAGGHEHWGDDL